jgi:mannan endo-1,4-beta-mannosidase
VGAALGMGRIVRECIGEIADRRPFFDSEHGPIHAFKDKHRKIPEDFDDEYFRHMQWAHLAAGGAGGGMRWPNRTPHVLTAGMRRAQKGLADFLPLIDWRRFDRRSLGPEVALRDAGGATVGEDRVARFACASGDQAVVYLLARDRCDAGGLLRRDGAPFRLTLTVPGLAEGTYRVTGWDTLDGRAVDDAVVPVRGGTFGLPDFSCDLAVAVRRQDA